MARRPGGRWEVSGLRMGDRLWMLGHSACLVSFADDGKAFEAMNW
jgi:hypothetical protein